MKTASPIVIGSLVLDSDQVNGLVEQATQKLVLELTQNQPDQERQHKQVVYSIQALQKQLSSLIQDNELVSKALSNQKTLSEQFYEHQVIGPMVRGVFPIVDMVRDLMTGSSDSSIKQSVQGLHTQLSQFLAAFGIEIYCHLSEEPFNPKSMKPLKQITTTDSTLKGLIAESLQCGFRKEQRILRMESVSLYQLQEKGLQSCHK